MNKIMHGALALGLLLLSSLAASAQTSCGGGTTFDKHNWYYAVATNPGNVWTSGRNQYVATSDGSYVSWLADGCITSQLNDETGLWSTLSNTQPNNPSVSYGQKIDFFVITNITIATDIATGANLQGFVLTAGQLVGLIGQSTASQNGVYTVSASPARDFSVFGSYLDFCCNSVFGGFIYIASGTYSGRLTQWTWTGAAAAIGSGSQLAAYVTATNYQINTSSGVFGLPVAGIGTGVSTAAGVNIGSAGAFVLFNGALGTPSSGVLTNATGLPLSGLTTQATNTVVGNATSGTAVPTALAVGSCSSASSSLIWTTNTGFGCNTSITANAVPAANLTGATLASGVTGSSLTSLGTITSLTATTINAFTLGGTIAGGGNQINNVIIGTSTPLAGSFTTLGASGTSTLATVNISGNVTLSKASPLFNFNGTDGNATFQVANNGTPEWSFILASAPYEANQLGVYDNINSRYTMWFGRTTVAPGPDNTIALGTSGNAWASVYSKGLATTATLTISSIASDTASTDNTMCITSAGVTLKGTGALGICLGTSGEQFKTDFEPMQAGLAELIQIDLMNYRYRPGFGDGGARKQYGTTAQNVERTLPDLARHDINGVTINYDPGALFFVGLRAIQELNKRLETMERRAVR